MSKPRRTSGVAVPARPRLVCAAPQAGVTLIELMIAVTLGMFLVLGTVMVYTSARESSRAQTASARLVENGRAASEILARTIRLSRYWGCAGQTAISVVNHLGFRNQGLFGLEGASGAPDELSSYQTDDPSGVQLLDVDDPGNSGLNPDKLDEDATVTLERSDIFKPGDYVVFNDCTKADVMEVADVAPGAPGSIRLDCSHLPLPSSPSPPFPYDTCTRTYQTNATVYKVRRSRFFIQNNAAGEPSLYLQTDAETPQELIEGIENIQFYYGEDTDDDGNINRYVTASVVSADCLATNNPDCWRGVGSVRISMLLRTTDDNVAERPQTYTFDGSTYTATDLRLRREYTTIVALRNHRIRKE